jgi:hypothetical protein
VIIIATIFIVRKCNPPSTDIQFVDVIHYDTIPADTQYIKIPHYLPGRDTIIYDTIPADVDTLEILKAYFSKAYYSDTITDDTTFTMVVNDVISQNTIISREAFHRNLKPEVIKTITKYPDPQRQYYIGVEAIASKSYSRLYLNGYLHTKNDKTYSLGVDPIGRGVKVGVAVNIKNINK